MSKASLTKKAYENSVDTHWDMLQKDVPIYSYNMRGFEESVAPYQHALREQVEKWNSQIRFTMFMFQSIETKYLNIELKHIVLLFSIWKTYQYLERLFQGEEAFLFSTTWQEFAFKSKYISKYGRKGYPLKRIKEK